ncbi:hypothetical protein Tco_0320890 [Tanacetum coccineum]
MDLQWEMAMLTIRARRFIKRTCRKLDVNGQSVGFDRSKVECYNFHKNGHFTRECKAPRNQENRGRENSRRIMTVKNPTKNTLVAQDRIGRYDWSYQAREEHPINYELMACTSSGSSSSSDSEVDSCSKSCVKAYATLKEQYDIESFVNSSEMLENQENNKSKSDKGYHVVPSPYTGNFIPSKPDLTFMDEIVESENMDVITVVTPSNVKKVESNHESTDVKNNGDAVEPKTVRKNSFRPPVIEDWNSDDDSEVEFIPNVKDKTVRPSTEKIKFIKTAREIVEKKETPKQNKHYPRGNQRNWNNLMSQRLGSDFKMINKACFVCGSFEHLHYVCDKKVIRPVWNNSSRVNHKNFANKMTHPHPNRRFVPQAVLTRSGKINTAGASVNTAVRPVNTAGSKTTVNHPRPISNAYKKGYSQVTRPFNKYSEYKNSIFNKKVNTVRVKDTTARDRAVVSENKGKGGRQPTAEGVQGKTYGADEVVHKEGKHGERAITTDASSVAKHRTGMDTGGSPRRQETMGVALAQTRSERVLENPNEPPLSEGHTSGSGEGSMEHTFELMDTVLNLEKEKDAQAVEILKLKQKVKKLERKRKSSISHPRRRIYRQVESSDDDLDEEDASKQGRESDKTKLMFQDSDFDVLDDDMEDVEGETVHTATTEVSAVSAPVTTDGVAISTAEPRTPPTTPATTFIDEDLTIAQTLIKMKEDKAKEKGVAIKDVEDSPRPIRSITTLQPLPTIDPTDKGKGVLVEEEPEKPEKSGTCIKKKRQKQEEATNAALAEEFDEIQARIDVDHELAVILTHKEQEKYTIKERARLLAEFFERRKKQLAAERAEAIRNKPPTRTQVRNMKITYLKHMCQQQAESTKKRPRADYEEESSNKQKLEEDNDAEKEELRDSMDYFQGMILLLMLNLWPTKYPI